MGARAEVAPSVDRSPLAAGDQAQLVADGVEVGQFGGGVEGTVLEDGDVVRVVDVQTEVVARLGERVGGETLDAGGVVEGLCG